MENLLPYKSAYKKCWLEAFIDCTYYYQIFTFFDERLNNYTCCALRFHWITKHDGQFSWVNWDFCRMILFKCAVPVNHSPLSMTILMLNAHEAKDVSLWSVQTNLQTIFAGASRSETRYFFLLLCNGRDRIGAVTQPLSRLSYPVARGESLWKFPVKNNTRYLYKIKHSPRSIQSASSGRVVLAWSSFHP